MQSVDGSRAGTGRQPPQVMFQATSPENKDERDMELNAINAEIRNLQMTLHGESATVGAGRAHELKRNTRREETSPRSKPSPRNYPPASDINGVMHQHGDKTRSGENKEDADFNINLSRFFSAANLSSDQAAAAPPPPQPSSTSNQLTMPASIKGTEQGQQPNGNVKRSSRHAPANATAYRNSGERLYDAAVDQQRRLAEKREKMINSETRKLSRLASFPTKLGKDSVKATVYRRRRSQPHTPVSPISLRGSGSTLSKTRIRRRSIDSGEQLYQRAIQQQLKIEHKRERNVSKAKETSTPQLNRRSLEIAENIGGNVLDRLYTAPLARRKERMRAAHDAVIRAPARARSMSVDYKQSMSPQSSSFSRRRASISGALSGSSAIKSPRKPLDDTLSSRSLEGGAAEECTFRPLISRNSMRLQNSRQSNSIEDFVKRTDEDNRERNRRLKQKQRERMQEQLNVCTFYPQTHSSRRDPAERTSSAEGSQISPIKTSGSFSSPSVRTITPRRAEDMYRRQSSWRSNIQARLAVARKEREEQSTSQCTFQPNIRGRTTRRRSSSMDSGSSTAVAERKDVSRHVQRQRLARKMAEETKKGDFLRDIHPISTEGDITLTQAQENDLYMRNYLRQFQQSGVTSSSNTSVHGSDDAKELPSIQDREAFGSTSAYRTEPTQALAASQALNDHLQHLSLSERIDRLTQARRNSERVDRNTKELLNRNEDYPSSDTPGYWPSATYGIATHECGEEVPLESRIREFLEGSVKARLQKHPHS